MNLNLAAYSFFLSGMTIVILYVGRKFYRNGRVFILGLLRGDEVLTDQINHLLLIGYYLFNLGYSFVQLRSWEVVTDTGMLIAGTSSKMGKLILMLAAMHCANMTLIYVFSKSSNHSKPNKSFQS